MPSRRHRKESNDPQPSGPRSNTEGPNQQEIKNLSERLAAIRLEIEQTFLLKEERRIERMERERRPKEEIEKEKKELKYRVADMEGIIKVLEQTRVGEEEIFLKRWHLQHDE
ncbi:hypothetical protein CEK26_002158 [Fusarium fujikuroi]|nr:hypothetical protein CEK27_002155 [Fusarium fujikuroi]QGI87199.1 hypothetical protein CEK25_002155 [Fusarium fujikuroi]QGJ00714.1 hypothetical protein CEK26_002158 [Fusarium fujikuroi]VTT64863.1 unnamed protein product [Fusarium fujikuroi]